MSNDPADHAGHGAGSHAGHGWMMIACCVPMIVIAVALVVTGAVSAGFLVVAALCVGMMALMMRTMNHGAGGDAPAAGHSLHGRGR